MLAIELWNLIKGLDYHLECNLPPGDRSFTVSNFWLWFLQTIYRLSYENSECELISKPCFTVGCLKFSVVINQTTLLARPSLLLVIKLIWSFNFYTFPVSFFPSDACSLFFWEKHSSAFSLWKGEKESTGIIYYFLLLYVPRLRKYSNT